MEIYSKNTGVTIGFNRRELEITFYFLRMMLVMNFIG
jgi:hypothetical protein